MYLWMHFHAEARGPRYHSRHPQFSPTVSAVASGGAKRHNLAWKYKNIAKFYPKNRKIIIASATSG